jgi:hypothetical protein
MLAIHLLAVAEAFDPRMLAPHAVAWLHDVAILAVLAAAGSALLRLAGHRAGGVLRVAVMAALSGAGMLLALYPRQLPVFLATPTNVFEADLGVASTFVADYLGWRALWPAGVPLLAGWMASRWSPSQLGWRWGLVASALLFGAALTLVRDSPHPFVYAIQDSVRSLGEPRRVPRLKTATGGTSASITPVPMDWTARGLQARYDHVVLVVLEGITARDFESEFIGRNGGFFEQHRSRTRYFANHHTTNLDTYTALLAMTTSVAVPFRAYAEPRQYAAVNDLPNIARSLGAASHRTLFISTYEHQPFVPNPADWTQVLDRRSLGTLDGFLSLGSSRMEAATEDRAALPAIVEFMRRGPRSLVMAALVFGHSPQWRARTGLAPLAYYDSYLTELWSRLSDAGLASRTLLVVVSDHGERSGVSDPANYRVPLLIIGEGVQAGRDSSLRSHEDFASILAHSLFGSALPPARARLRLVGSTERWIYGAITASGEHAFIDDGSGRVLSGQLEPGAVQADFQDYLTAFTTRFSSSGTKATR